VASIFHKEHPIGYICKLTRASIHRRQFEFYYLSPWFLALAHPMNSNFDNPYNPGDICKIKSVFLHDPLHDAFTSAEMRFNQLCLHPDFVADRNDRDARRRAKSGRPCVVLDKNLMDGSCTIALFCTFEGDDINLVSSIYRCYSLSVFPTFRVPSCPEGEYALDLDTKPLHTTPEWKLPPRKDNPTELKDQWVLTLPLQVSKQDLNKLRPWPGSVALDPIELARFRKICHKVGDLFVERFKSPAELTMASQSVMVRLHSTNIFKFLPNSIILD